MMEYVFPLAALAATMAGSVCLYLGMPRQQWLARPWPARASRGGGALLLPLGWLAWCGVIQPVTAFFAVLTVSMAVLILLPAAVAARVSVRRTGP